MKQYGANQATEFTKKQISVIYSKAKNGELEVEKWFMSNLYDLADYYGYDSNGTVARDEQRVLKILDLVFAGNIEEAQELIAETQNEWFELLGRKAQGKINRSILVG